MITSNQNPKMKLARALLGRPKERRESETFVAEGVRLVEEALRAEWPIRYVLLDEVDRILDKISSQGMGSLTPQERLLLDEASRRGRSN